MANPRLTYKELRVFVKELKTRLDKLTLYYAKMELAKSDLAGY